MTAAETVLQFAQENPGLVLVYVVLALVVVGLIIGVAFWRGRD